MIDNALPCAAASESMQMVLAALNTIQVVMLAYLGSKARDREARRKRRKQRHDDEP